MVSKMQASKTQVSEVRFHLKPLVAGMRFVVASGMFVSAMARAELPVPIAGQGWVSSGSATNQIIGDTLRIDQQTDRAILNWQSFNVGRENTVQFVQPSSTSIALNRIYQESPSTILGKITANGQIYLYNQNGFVFGKDSVVNANSLIASTLNISDEVFERGITQIFDENGKAAFGERPDANDPTTLVNESSTIRFEKGLKTDKDNFLIDQNGNRIVDQSGNPILVSPGFDTNNEGQLIDANGQVILNNLGKPIFPVPVEAQIHADKNGRIIIVAPNIENKASLSADQQGQIILAASQDKVYLQAADSESDFAGLLVEVDTGGKVINSGDINVREGNVTLAGFAVNQEGRVSATTSVNVNGSIRLLAQEQHTVNGGKLVANKTTRTADLGDGLGTESKLRFASGSVTEIVADQAGGSAIEEQDQPQSYFEAQAHTVSMESGSAIVAPSGKVNITATNNPQNPGQGTAGRIYIADDALIDVSGSEHVSVAMERNVGEISVQSFDLRDAPVQKSGPLKGEKVRVDLRKGSKIVDTSGAEARVEKSLAERLGQGGEINLTSSGDVVIGDSATIDISGGSVDYRGGVIDTTLLMTESGQIVDISDADPNEHYVSIFGVVDEDHDKWGFYRQWSLLGLFGTSRYEAGYTEGLDAGSLKINAPVLSGTGHLIAGSHNGVNQRQSLGRADGGSFVFDSTAFVGTLQDVRFQTEKNHLNLALEDDFPYIDGKPQALVLSSELTNSSGLQHVVVKTLANVTVAEDANINMAAGSEFNVQAAAIDIQGEVHTAGGEITLAIAESLAGVNLGAHSLLDVSGRWVNDLPLGFDARPVDALIIDGGSVKVSSVGDLHMHAGAKIKADGGGWLDQSGRLTPGDGGSIELVADGQGIASRLYFDGEVSAAALGKGGSLTLGSSEIVIGNGTALTANPLRLAVSNGRFDFDSQGSFSEVNLIGNLDGVTVSDGTVLDLKTASLVLDSNFTNNASDRDIRSFSQLAVLPEHLRQGNALNLSSRGNVVVGNNSSISMDKQGSVSLVSSLGGVYVDGTIATPGGNIRLAIEASPNAEYDNTQTVRLGEHARLLAQGSTRLNLADALGRRNGEVLDGGVVSFDLQRGSLIFEQGSIVDVSGTHTVLDLPQPGTAGEITAPVDVFGNAGQVDIAAAEGAVFDGKFIGLVSSDNARGGRFSFILDRTRRSPPDEPLIAFPNNPLVVRIRDEQQPLFDYNVGFGDAIPNQFNGQATISASMLEQGGFTDIRLTAPDKILFEGSVSLDAAARVDLDSAVVDWAALNGETSAIVDINSALIRLGSSLQREVTGTPVTGGATFNANAQWIELFGGTRWDGINSLTLNSAHDIRAVGLRFGAQRDFLGALVTAANLNLKASQIYPTTLSDFTFAVKNNPTGQITVGSSGNTDQTPLSAAGVLTMEAPLIEQGGVIKAPLGNIHLKAGSRLTLQDNSLTSVSGEGKSIPFGVIQAGLDWIYPLDSVRNLVFDTPPEKRLVLEAPELLMEQGSVVNLSGGGDFYGYEFLPGAGGSYDYLNPNSDSYEGGFAILPSLGSDLAPFDHYEYNFVGWSYEIGSKVYLDGSSVKGLAAGSYTILPAHYALLPGAYLVTPQAGSQDQSLTQFTSQGLPVVTGYFTQAGTGTRDARWSGFKIENGADIRLRSQYEEHLANDYYTAQAAKNETVLPLLAMDSGQISLIAETMLTLESQFMFDALPGGRGARMDIAADKIHVVNNLSASPQSGILEILATDLNGLGVDSLLLGGARNRDVQTGETSLSVTAEEVVFAEDSQITGKDLIAAATDKVEVKDGASLSAEGTVNTGDKVFNVSGDGAFLRVSADKQVTLNRTGNVPGAKGQLTIFAGATLSASESMLLDASKSTVLQGDILMQQGSLNLSAKNINLGEVNDQSSSALNLSNSRLLNLSVDELILSARDSIGVYGNLGQVDENGAPVIGVGGLQEAIHFKRLVIDSAGLTGHGQVDDRARIQADTLRLQNSHDATNSQVADGVGQIDLLGNSIEIGDGGLVMQGFNAVNLQATTQFRADGEANLTVSADLNVTTPVLTGKGGASLIIDMAGYDAHFMAATALGEVSSGFGAKLAVTADNIDFNSQVLLPSGAVDLHALNGAVSLGSEAKLDLAGRAVKFADIYDYTPGGRFSAIADQGQVILAAGSLVDLDSGGGSATGGELTLSAPTDSIDLEGEIQASNGSASLDVNHFGNGTSFDDLMRTLSNAGINQSIYFRTHTADIVQAANSVIEAENVTLVADTGNITLAGGINADGSINGGNIDLYAGDMITLQTGATLTAKGDTGGNVLLSSTDNDNDAVSGIDIEAGALIDVSGAELAQGGEVTLRALRDGNGIKIQPIAGTVQGFARQAAVYDDENNLLEHGYSHFFAEGVKKYTDANGFLTSSDYSTIQADTDNYMTVGNMQAVAVALGEGVRLRAGVEVNYDGNLTLVDKWDLADWRYSEGGDSVAMPGTLSIRAGGGLSLLESLSDGFKDGEIASPLGNGSFTDMLQSGESWSYRLVAGADLSSADLAATRGSSNFVVGSNVSVRTGTGDMQLVASGDFVLTDQTSTVYNAGRTTEIDPYGSLALHMAISALPYADYPVDGGSLVINAGGDIKGAVNNSQFINDWMVRQGSQNYAEDFYLASVAADLVALKDNAAGLSAYIDTLPAQIQANIHDAYKLDTFAYSEPTTWGLVLGNGVFQQNIGSFGGGKVVINAAGNIDDLSVMMPTSGKQIGAPAWDPNNLQTLSTLTNQVEVSGGGQMVVKAGGDIAGGAYYLGQGSGSLLAGASVKGGSQFTKGPQLLLGDTKMTVQSNRDLTLEAVSDPMMLHTGETNFFSYGDNSEVIAKSMSGDVHLSADITKVASLINLGSSQIALAQVYPAGLSATAFGGSVVMDNDVVLFPAPRANVNVLAEQDFKSKGAASRLAMSDADRALLPTALTPVARNEMSDAVARISPYGLSAFAHAASPVHAGDTVPVRLVTKEGDITNVQVNLAKKAVIQTGRDFKNVLLQVQHDNEDDGTVLNIGRDLKFTSNRDQNGQLVPNINEINITGPGNVLFKTGRNFDLGASVGVSTSGNLTNTALADSGADISVLVGLKDKEPAYVAFIEKYLSADTQYPEGASQIKNLITGFMRERLNDPSLSEDQAWVDFKNLSANDYLTLQPKLNALVVSAYMNEVMTAGIAAAKAPDSEKKAAYQRGFDAIETLFPGEDWRGDLSMFFSKIHTLDDGSINLLVPGGQVNAGLAVGTDAKKPSELGIVVQRAGDINAVVRDDFLVNQSRVFALASGDIMLWSSKGDLNAGAGAKSSIAAPPPQITFDENGNLVIVFPPIVSGSGIRTAAEAGKTQGNVGLFAPEGVVDAGEAGIGGNNVTISATAVLGANNIQVSGVGTGVPVASTGSLAAGLTGVGNLTSGVTQMAENSVGGDMSKGAANALAKAILGMLSVEVIGFGE